MSQRAVFVRVSGNLIPEVFTYVPDYDEMVMVCREHGYDGSDGVISYCLAEYEWIEIGEGESGMDTFLDDETLLAVYDRDDYVEHIRKLIEKDVEVIESGSIEVLIEDIQEES